MVRIKNHIVNQIKRNAFESRAIAISINPSLDIINILGIIILGLLGLSLLLLVG